MRRDTTGKYETTLETRGVIFLIFLTLCSCAHYPDTLETPKYRIPVHIEAGVTVDGGTVLSWVDLRADEWIANKAAWGCGNFTDWYLGELLRLEPVIVYPAYYLPDCPYIGYNDYEDHSPQIHVSINYPALRWGGDLICGVGIPMNEFDYSYGLRQLPHEWTHTARGSWHP